MQPFARTICLGLAMLLLAGCGNGAQDDPAAVTDAPAAESQAQEPTADTSGEPSIQERATARADAISAATAAAPATQEARAARDTAYGEDVREEIASVVESLFAVAMGQRDAELEDLVIRRMSTTRLAQLRRSPTPQPGAYGRGPGDIWVVGFRTPLTVTPETMVVDNAFELRDVPAEAYADDEGRTTVYFIMTVIPDGDRLSYTPVARGVLPADGASWTLAELEAVPQD